MVDISIITPVVRRTPRYGWKPPLPDPRFRPRFRFSHGTPVPEEFVNSTSPFNPPIYNQGDIGSCTGNGLGRAFAFARAKQGCTPLWNPSRLLIYINERIIEDSVRQDAGASIQDGVKTLKRAGVCDEALWPYDVTQFATMPPDSVYAEAANHKALVANPIVQSPNEIRAALAEGFPIVFGFVVWSSFESADVARTGMMPVPDTDTEHILGGHCTVAFDYWNSRGVYKCANSWGEEWGDQGYFYAPYEFMHSPDFASDFWQITGITD